jgi:hypothetical protein
MIRFSGKKEYINLKGVGMIKEYCSRLKELALEHLNCSLDDNEPGYIPDDLKENTYRWNLYLYSNLYKIGADTFDNKDRQMFMDIAQTFRKEHLISWTRDRLIELDRSKVLPVLEYVKSRIENTISFFELKVCIYMFRDIYSSWFVVDPFIIEMSPGLKDFIVNE